MISEENPAFTAIANLYADRTAKRSGVALLNHIREGLIILDALGATEIVQEAYCLHPIFQDTLELLDVVKDDQLLASLRPSAIVHAMEYRAVANAYLSGNDPDTMIQTSPLIGVNQMLIADKVQNRKDFLKYHQGHENFNRLNQYFKQWLTALQITDQRYEELVSLIEDV